MDDTQLILDAANRAAPPTDATELDREGLVRQGAEEAYCIPRSDELSPFLMSIVSAGDLWMYVSSRGGLTAGRRGPDHALFGYETDDRLHHLHGITGPFTLVRAAGDDELVVWEPFSPVADGRRIVRRLYKSVIGNSVVFEEDHLDLELTFRYRWQNCQEFGFVRSATLINRSPHDSREVDVLDGLLNILPAGATLSLQQTSSCLVDAYKLAEHDRAARLAIYSLSSMVSDRAEPAESLRASVAWCRGLTNYRILLSDRQVQAYRRGKAIQEESKLRGVRGAFLVSTRLHLRPGQAISWDIVADTDRSQQQVAGLRRFLINEPHPYRVLQDRIHADTTDLVKMVAVHDGLQATADRKIAVHHFANVLFNTMRGGALADQGLIDRGDFSRFVDSWNHATAVRHHDLLAALPSTCTRAGLLETVAASGDPALTRLAHEFLPLTFGRRHGDPSRPWNRFEIRVRDDSDRRVLAYQGNWRDIFQNWEALSLSFPAYIESFIAKFVNASTADGFNPYRLSHEGIEWETPDPHNPWANIGYWGDHQIVYLTRLLELSRRYHPHTLERMLTLRAFTYADVPYRLRPYESLLTDGRNTIDFDARRDAAVRLRAARLGADGKLLQTVDGEVLHVTLAEKLLVPVLAKLCNLVPGGGIWLNTQRPEWNDANNALAGHGLSVVTLCHLRRHIALLLDLASSNSAEPLRISSLVATWLRRVAAALADHAATLGLSACDDRARKSLMDALGGAFSDYRSMAYESGVGEAEPLDRTEIATFLQLALKHIDHSIHANRRADGLYHAYNLLSLAAGGSSAGIERLQVMLEGQVAVLSSGLLDAAQSAAIVDALFDSELFSPSTGSFLLYPDRPTAGFLDKNVIPAPAVDAVGLLRDLLAAGDGRLICRDADGNARFAPDLHNATDVQRLLERLSRDPGWSRQATDDAGRVMEVYEQVFHHHAFTGRSGAMAGYEGLGCVYWHMVAKLLLAIQEAHDAAVASGAGDESVWRLADAYHRVRRGLGFNKSAREYGAFPTDPYSHTPAHAGARQPGMTGQVKEEIITRLGELGVRVSDGSIRFCPRLLPADEFARQPQRFEYVGPDGSQRTVDLPAEAMAFTLCQVPVVYRLETDEPRIIVIRPNNVMEVVPGDTLDTETSRQILDRTGQVVRLEVDVRRQLIRCKHQNLPSFQKDRPGSASGVPEGRSGSKDRVTS